jgi:hypothetical protein
MVEKQRRASRCVPVIVTQQPTETISTHDRTALAASLWLWSHTLITETLMMALRMIVGQVLMDRIIQGAFTPHDHLLQGLLLDGAHKPFTMGVQIRTPREFG